MYNCISLMAIAAILLFSCSINKYNEEIEPDEHRFSQEVFLTNLNEPVEMEVMPNGNILFVQRKGGMRLYDTENMKMLWQDSLPVFYGFEDGLMGMALDPNYDKNHWIYLYYSPLGNEPKQHLSRFLFDGNSLSDEKIMLVVPTQRDECCHTGGSIEFSADGLLYLSTGDDTNPFKSNGYAPIDDREGRRSFDARGTASNTNDLRGKILRIRPEEDGTYSIPSGNLFEDDDPITRPEIYVMGCRNPYRISVDQKRGWLFWGDVGPDAGENDSVRGPRGHDEMNVAMKAGYYGWPMFIGDNKPYGDWDFDQLKINGFFNPQQPINDSRFNTGLKNLPPATPAMIYYPYSNSAEFPQLTNGGRTAMTGQVFYKEDGMDKKQGFPSYFNERLFIYDWMRDWIFTITVDENGTPSDFVPFTPSATYSNIIDMDFGPDGKLYVLEYGTAWFKQNADARLSRINFNRGNRVPIMDVALSTTTGSSPLTVTLDASKSVDYDGDPLSFVWKIGDEEFKSDVVSYTFVNEGIHRPRLTLTDGQGHTLIEQFKIEVGNDAPQVDIAIEGNNSFYWPGRKINYKVNVNDQQDGSLNKGIAVEDVQFNVLYMDGYDQSQVLGHKLPVTSGETLITKSDCMSCHKINDISVGPSFTEVSKRYKNDPKAVEYLTAKIIKGGSGAWGDHSMSAHPDFTQEETKSMVDYVLSLGQNIEVKKPLSGIFEADLGENKKLIVLSAQYTDKGVKKLSAISALQSVQLQPNVIQAGKYDESNKIGVNNSGRINSLVNQSWLMYRDIDLTDIQSVDINMKKQVNEMVILSIRIGQLEGEEIAHFNLENDFSTGDIKSITGRNDIYFVFSSDEKEMNLIQLFTLKFNPK